MIVIKTESELRHVLAHMLEAIRLCAQGDGKTAEYEIDSIEGLVLFADDESFRRYVNGMYETQEAEETKQTSKTT